jgi:oxygen-dependent protoporphyrinogen oxidase
MRIVIVGGGISGLSLAYVLLERKPNLDITVLESDKKAGGKIWTDKVDGFLCEGGVNGFLDNRPNTLELIGKLALTSLRSSDKARKRYIFSEKKLRLLPESPRSFFTSDILSLYGRLRVAYEIFVPRKQGNDETLADFARRRLGTEAYEKFIDPMASGIFAGDPENMSLKSCFPKVHLLELQYGSLIRGMIRLQKEAKKSGKKVGPGPGGVLTSFYDGMETLVDGLKHSLGQRLETNKKVVSIDRKNGFYTIYLSDNTSIEAESVIVASPAHVTAEIVKDMDKQLSMKLNEIYYPSISVVCLGFKRTQIQHPLDGFGFLIPNREKRKVLGTLWDSSIFPNRAPEGYVLLRSMVGGVRMSDLALADNEGLVQIVLRELHDIMEIHATPDFIKVYKHEKGIPQYSAGHEKRLEDILKKTNNFKGFYLAGNAYRGIGVNDCIENSYKLAERIFKEYNF